MHDMNIELPPLPPFPVLPQRSEDRGKWIAWANEHARAAVMQERERLAAKWEAAHGFDKHGVAAAIRKG
jgi:hypothetical protein